MDTPLTTSLNGSTSVFWLNSFTPTNGISTTLIPWTLLTGDKLSYNKHCRTEFCAYAQVNEEHDNSMGPRTVGSIELGPTGNLQGGHYFSQPYNRKMSEQTKMDITTHARRGNR